MGLGRVAGGGQCKTDCQSAYDQIASIIKIVGRSQINMITKKNAAILALPYGFAGFMVAMGFFAGGFNSIAIIYAFMAAATLGFVGWASAMILAFRRAGAWMAFSLPSALLAFSVPTMIPTMAGVCLLQKACI